MSLTPPSLRSVTSNRNRSTGFLVSILLGLALATTGCAQLGPMLPAISLQQDLAALDRLTPAGPGYVFATVEEAAIDALAYCYLETRGVLMDQRRARAGGIRRVDGGFTYDEPGIAKRPTSGRVAYKLSPAEVAHFRHVPNPVHRGAAARMSHRNDAASIAARFVEERDARHRPLYVMDSDRRMVVHTLNVDSKGAEALPLARIAFGTRRDATELALHRLTPENHAQPLAWDAQGPLVDAR